MKIGMIGLGNMGAPMCRNLAKVEGFAVSAFDINPAAAAALADAGVEAVAEMPALIAGSDVVITSLPTPGHVETVALGINGIAAHARRGTVLIDLSTSSPRVSRKVADGLRPAGVDMLEAPVTGGVPRAEDGSLTIMVAGDEAVFERHRAIFAALSAKSVHIGAIGTASVTKLLNNMMLLSGVTLAAEALAIAEMAGVDRQKFVEIVSAGSGNSFGFGVLASGKPSRFALDLAYKDLRLAIDLEEEFGVSGLIAAASLDVLRRARQRGMGANDLVEIGKLYEREAVRP